MSSTDLFDAITALPPEEKTALLFRLVHETDLLEDWRDIAVFDARKDEESVLLDEHFQKLGLSV